VVYGVGYGVSGRGTGKGEQGTGPDQARSRQSQDWVSGDNLETSIPFPFPPSPAAVTSTISPNLLSKRAYR